MCHGRHVEELALDPVRHGRIESVFARPPNYPLYEAGDRSVLTHPNVEVLVRIDVLRGKYGGVGEVIDMEELALQPAGSPQLNLCCSGPLGFHGLGAEPAWLGAGAFGSGGG